MKRVRPGAFDFLVCLIVTAAWAARALPRLGTHLRDALRRAVPGMGRRLGLTRAVARAAPRLRREHLRSLPERARIHRASHRIRALRSPAGPLRALPGGPSSTSSASSERRSRSGRSRASRSRTAPRAPRPSSAPPRGAGRPGRDQPRIRLFRRLRRDRALSRRLEEPS